MKTKPTKSARRKLVEEFIDEVHTQIRSDWDLEETINRGGCCVFAVFAACHLTAMGYTPRLRVCDNNHANAHRGIHLAREEARSAPCNNEFKRCFSRNVGFDHVWVEVKVGHTLIWFDGKTVTFPRHGRDASAIPGGHFGHDAVYRGALTLDEATTCASSPSWNWCFDRGQIPVLEELVATAADVVSRRNNLHAYATTPYLPA